MNITPNIKIKTAKAQREHACYDMSGKAGKTILEITFKFSVQTNSIYFFYPYSTCGLGFSLSGVFCFINTLPPSFLFFFFILNQYGFLKLKYYLYPCLELFIV